MIKNELCKCQQEVSEDDLYATLDDILMDYKDKPGALIPVLQITQKIFGYLPKKALKKIAKELGKSYSEVSGVVTFYSFFTTVPKGKYMIRVCLGTACYVRGGKDVFANLKKELKIDVGETTDDKLFSIEVGRCFGACGLTPVIIVNDDVHQRVKADKVGNILEYYRKLNDGKPKETKNEYN